MDLIVEVGKEKYTNNSAYSSGGAQSFLNKPWNLKAVEEGIDTLEDINNLKFCIIKEYKQS